MANCKYEMQRLNARWMKRARTMGVPAWIACSLDGRHLGSGAIPSAH
jgi:hypothetical protein